MNHSNLSDASKAFGKIAVEQSNPAAAALAIHLAIASAEAYAAELEQRQAIAAAVADSIATALPVDVAIPYVNIDAAIAFLRSRFVDVDWDTFPTYVTIFGDDQRIQGDEEAGLWVLNLVFAPAPARFAY